MARRVLHLVGSPTSQFYAELSEIYARGCLDALHSPEHYTVVIALVTPDGLWRFPRSLDREAIDAAEPVKLARALSILAAEKIDIALPQMFCIAGMTHYRALLDILGIAYLGNRPMQMALTADKAKTRAIVAESGVRVPKAQLLRRGDIPTLVPPVVVKPNDGDNSEGVSLVRSFAEYTSALDDAFSYSALVLLEEYVELGREVRCGIVVSDGKLVCLPLEEYLLDPLVRPIRSQADKLKRNDQNALTFAAKDLKNSWIVDRDDPIVAPVWAMARKCHEAIGCQQYSLFDFRIDPQGQPWFLEAGLYCSFSPKSVLSAMMAAAGTPLDQFFADAIDQRLDKQKTTAINHS